MEGKKLDKADVIRIKAFVRERLSTRKYKDNPQDGKNSWNSVIWYGV